MTPYITTKFILKTSPRDLSNSRLSEQVNKSFPLKLLVDVFEKKKSFATSSQMDRYQIKRKKKQAKNIQIQAEIHNKKKKKKKCNNVSKEREKSHGIPSDDSI
ncbi:CLUMA_CG019695, isoform A [Clunio marinus]|uniref:CLUMA_CG019695, isoform A n=1 Tax=Clunio marinus TaxID=568069 RepID=A0A1J1J312_9DIPT|nr:CLUMA_CG019695, isoform A [Clunio marinus]